MCQRNWPKYNASLVQRGSLTFFCHPRLVRELKKAQKKAPNLTGRPGYSPQLITLLILLKISFGLTYRRCEGMALSLLGGHGIRIPSYATLCRRIGELSSLLPSLSRRRPKTLLIDSSGFKVSGEGEWKTKVHGRSYHRNWIKVHLVVDSKTNEVVDLIVTPNSTGDSTTGSELLERAQASVKLLYADGAYDGFAFRELANRKGIRAIIPPPSHAKVRHSPELEERNQALSIIEALGGDRTARRIWGRLTGYCHRVKVESAFSRLKRLFGHSIFSRRPEAQFVEIWLKAWLSNKWLNWGVL